MFSLFRLQNNIDSAFFYQNYAQVMTDSLYGPQKFKQLQLLMMDEQQRQQVALQEKEGSTNRIKFAALFSALGFSLLFAFILIRNNSNKQKANNLLKEQKEKIEETLSVLKATQSQLIQSEKMASLGELTAGIAHEIQNPLNFVNNFSEVNSELMEEIVQEAVKGNLEEVKTIARDVKENEEKINFHGKRASDIVKGMLQHSRGSSGKKELTDINNLCDEYLRLSYHGYRAKDKSFSAKYATDFDTSLPKLSVVPQDIGRVVLNLINNAFYAVSEKTKLQAAGYEPQVVVTTKENGDKILISVKDNGNGIPQNIVDKIFQPFFTTKPTGQGTGLGLSLSYDIVKAHGGELKVETKEGEGSTFIIELTS
ncbi:MAG: GHKL domain-containing protein [Cyclobacteriaceae bacterium]|nr:GHKL domain-containing protein [Cyclobacteriaceae bacterium]